MITRQAWALARTFADRIGIPPGGRCLTSEAAWRVILIARVYEEAAEVAWRQALVQAVVSGGTSEGFEIVSKAFRRYRETLLPWVGKEREEEERRLMGMVEKMSKYQLQVSPLKKTGRFTDMAEFKALIETIGRKVD